METLEKINDIELMEFTSGDIENANEKIINNSGKHDNKVRLSIWEYILILLHLKSLNAIVLDEFVINNTWEKVILKHNKNEQSEKPANIKKSTSNGIQSYLRKVGV